MRAEPGTPPSLLELARALFANGNRLARTAMALEALSDASPSRPATANDFVATCADAVQAIATALREQRAPGTLPELRTLQQVLVASLQAEEHAETEPLARLSDRLTDNIDTLAHVLRRARDGRLISQPVRAAARPAPVAIRAAPCWWRSPAPSRSAPRSCP